MFEPAIDLLLALIFSFMSFKAIRSLWKSRHSGLKDITVDHAKALRGITWQFVSAVLFWVQFIRVSGLGEYLSGLMSLMNLTN